MIGVVVETGTYWDAVDVPGGPDIVHTFFGRGEPAVPIHVAIDRLEVVGNDAWVSGTITASTFAPIVGLPAITRVRDNGTSANDPADQVAFTLIDTGLDCHDKPTATPDFDLFDLNNGQVKVR